MEEKYLLVQSLIEDYEELYTEYLRVRSINEKRILRHLMAKNVIQMHELQGIGIK